MTMADGWRQSEDAMRTVIAREIWRYQKADEYFGDFDTVDDPEGMAAFVKKMCIDEAEGIRKVVLGSAVFKAAFAYTSPHPSQTGISGKIET